jgi:hypothetical protein
MAAHPYSIEGLLTFIHDALLSFRGESSSEVRLIKRPATIRQCYSEGAAMFARHVSLQQQSALRSPIGEWCSKKRCSMSKPADD